jgi:CRISPR-associated protein Csx17
MTTCEHVLEGCAPIPLAGYLKALGVLRLVAEQKDPEARGFWRNERFVLRTRLTREEVVGFFLTEYHPTPVTSPWNAGSGFYFREGKAKEKDPATGKLVKTGVRDQPTAATRVLDGILTASAERLQAYHTAIQNAKALLAASNLDAAPGDDDKAELIRALRSEAPDATVAWLDASATVTQLEVAFPPLLGSGGNDGNLDFSTTFMQAIASLMDVRNGAPSATAMPLLSASLFADAMQTGGGTAISQFSPSAIDAPNSGVGFSGTSSGNAWDVVLALEGALIMATALARRVGADGDGAASFPFMVAHRGVLGAGAGNVAHADENARGELWAPLWTRPAALGELKALFREGRAVVGRETANDALDFAQALGRLGVDRGVNQFERYAFEQRYGTMHIGVPLGRRGVTRNPNADLIADITASGWLGRARSAVRGKGAPASMLGLGRRLDDALFRLAEDKSSDAVQEALIAIGALAVATGQRPKLRERPPPPRLSSAWAEAADDGSPEFAIAAALASLDAMTEDGSFRLPFRRHLAPLSGGKGRDAWDETTEVEAQVVWSGRDLQRDMADVLERRLIEAQRRPFVRYAEPSKPELPLRSRRTASLAAVAAFLDASAPGRRARCIDDDRIAALAAGLAWTRPTGRAQGQNDREDILSFAFAALRPLLDPPGVAKPRLRKARKYGVDDTRGRKRVDPLPLVRLLQAGRIDDALIAAQRLARGAGLSASFDKAIDRTFRSAADVQRWPQGGAAQHLAAALLIPLSDAAIEALAWRAYPENLDEEDTDAA